MYKYIHSIHTEPPWNSERALMTLVATQGFVGRGWRREGNWFQPLSLKFHEANSSIRGESFDLENSEEIEQPERH